MKKFDGMLFCTDLDGTLYDDNKKVSKRNLDAIEFFKSEGGIFTFITGRVPKTSVAVYDIIKPNAPYGCFNGGAIYDAKKGEYLWHESLPTQAIELVRAVDKYLPEMGIQFNTEKEIYINKDNGAMKRFIEITGVEKVELPYEEVKESVLKVVFAHSDATQIEALAKLLNAQPNAKFVDFIRSELTLYEILPKGISKGTALCKMAELLGIDKNKTIAVGDYNNDIAMIKMAKCGFAVKNAVDEAKQVADYITVSNNDDAIAEIIYGIENGKYIV